VPNVRGLATAPALLRSHPKPGKRVPYGTLCYTEADASGIRLSQVSDDATLAVVTVVPEASAKAALGRITPDTVAAVNAFLRPYGKVKHYWRTNQYRWHPLTGAPVSAPATVAPVAATPAPVAAPVAPAPVVPAAPVAPVAASKVSLADIETAMTWQSQGFAKKPVIREVGYGYSMVADVLAPTEHVKRLNGLIPRRAAGKAANGLITGPAGTAKTKLAVNWAFTHDLPVVVIEGQSIQTASDWFGALVPNDEAGATSQFRWVWSDAALLIMTGKPCAIVIDELNRPENERALNGVMGLLDWRSNAKPVGAPHAVRLQPGQIVLGTLNEGSEYVGTVEIDKAVRSRFVGAGVRMGYTSEGIEARIIRQQVPGIDATEHGPEVSRRLARIAHQQRAKVAASDGDQAFPSGTTLDTRAVVSIGESIVLSGLTPREAIMSAVQALMWPEDEDKMNALIESQFGPAPEEIAGSEEDIENMLDASGY